MKKAKPKPVADDWLKVLRKRERARIVRFLRKRAKTLTRFTWYNPEASVGALADEIEAMK